MNKLDFSSLDAPQELYIPIPPVPASRPKVSRFATYYSKRHQEYVKHFVTYFNYDKPIWTYLPDEALLVALEFACERPKKPSRHSPRYDIDNLVKLPLDCMTSFGGFWKDDVQIDVLIASKRYAIKGEEPHTSVRCYKMTT